MFRLFIPAIAAAAAIAVTLSPGAISVAVAEPSAQAEKSGKQIYRRHCVHCHGGQRQRFSGLDQSTFNNAVIGGTNLMPNFEQQLSGAELEQLWRYLNPQSPLTSAQ